MVAILCIDRPQMGPDPRMCRSHKLNSMVIASPSTTDGVKELSFDQLILVPRGETWGDSIFSNLKLTTKYMSKSLLA